MTLFNFGLSVIALQTENLLFAKEAADMTRGLATLKKERNTLQRKVTELEEKLKKMKLYRTKGMTFDDVAMFGSTITSLSPQGKGPPMSSLAPIAVDVPPTFAPSSAEAAAAVCPS